MSHINRIKASFIVNNVTIFMRSSHFSRCTVEIPESGRIFWSGVSSVSKYKGKDLGGQFNRNHLTLAICVSFWAPGFWEQSAIIW